MNLSFRVYFSLSRKIDITIESFHVHILSAFIQCNFFCYCSLCSSFSVALLLNARVIFVTFIYPAHLSKSVHARLGREIRVQFKCFVHGRTTVHFAEVRRVQCSVRFVPTSTFSSAKHLINSVHGLFQSVIRPNYRLAFVCRRVAIGTKYDVCYFVVCLSWFWACSVLLCSG